MTVVELNARKAELVKSILNDVDSEETLDEIEKLIRKNTIYPCQYTPEQLRERAMQAIEQMEQGEGIPHEKIKKRFSA